MRGLVVETHRDDSDFDEYSAISAAFEVRERVELSRLRATLPQIPTCPVAARWTKDYDAAPANGPTAWPVRFDIREWLVLGAYTGSRRVGGAIVVTNGSAATLGARTNCGLLWDLRVVPDLRGRGIGRVLLAEAERAAAAAGRHALDVETQDINVPDCRLYAAAGYRLLEVKVDAYVEAPGEARLVWAKDLG